ncbi:MAG: ATP-binding cassette domain-containing protein [Deltaproteobacteria bacterium]|jgi:subfamily B ATP-binding cassette protein MsbA|nr:ATP-binding cassette domain-containing protein [Deltaproteobacteria bacterium]
MSPPAKNSEATGKIARQAASQAARRLLGLIKPHRLKLFLAVISMALAAASTAGMAYLIKPLLDHVFFFNDKDMLLPLTALTCVVYCSSGFFSFFQSYLMNKVGYTIVNDLRVALFSHVEKQSLSFHDKRNSGELIGRVVNDVSLIQSSVTQVVTGLALDLCKVVGLVAVLFSRDFRLTLMCLVALPLVIFPIYRFGLKLRKLATDSQVIMGSLIVVLTETLQGVRMIQSYNMTDFEISRFATECRKSVDNLMHSVTVRSLSSSIMEIFGGLCLSAVIFYGGLSVVQDKTTPGTFFSFMTALLLLYEPLKRLTRLNSEAQQGLAAAIRIFETIDLKPEIVSPPGGLVISRAKGLIEFKNVSFTYGGSRAALNNINLTVAPGEMVALVGHSGGGKTTLVNLVPRFYDASSGVVLLDGFDVRGLDLISLREQVALVSQEVTLFEASVRHNIAYGRLEASMEQVTAAAKAALADGFIAELPGGYEENIGERGAKLSGGQRQRLSIARAILKDAPILILDEATSSLDAESEKLVRQALENLTRDRTTLVIAHRLSTVVKSDRIVVLKGGFIVEEGAHEELMERGGEYFRLYSLQNLSGPATIEPQMGR